MLTKRIAEAREARTLPDLESLYLNIGIDLAELNSYMVDDLSVIQTVKAKIVADNPQDSVAGQNRLFEATPEYKLTRTYKYWVDGLVSLKAGIRVKINSYKNEEQGL